jgi:excinuclease UvrABC helicase subunit UvrB
VTVPRSEDNAEPSVPAHELPGLIKALRKDMKAAANNLEFEEAGALRDRINELEERRLRLG